MMRLYMAPMVKTENCKLFGLTPFSSQRVVTGWLLFNAALTLRVAAAEDLSVAKYMNPSLPVETRIDDLLPRLTLAEKITMLGGDETRFNACGVERLGIPPIRMTDGPVGVRTGAATAWPVSINMAASWDTNLIQRYGVALAEEVKAKGKNCILGPCVGIHRFPLNGRNFESFGEDPFLSGRIAVSYIQGVQSQNVIATVKHFACNDQEWQRNRADSVVDERTLREIHLPAFEAAVTEGKVRAVMSAYNLVNGQHCSENKHLLTDILKGDWGFQGIVMSDWVSVYSAVAAANNGLDLEMPRPVWFGERLLEAVQSGQVSEQTIDDKIRRLLRVRFESGLFENPSPKPDESVVRSAAHRALALEMAQKSIVLLKNDGLLPLSKDKLKTIAFIGPAANIARTGGGGSSTIQPWEKVSPVAGMKNLLGDRAKVLFAAGVNMDPVKAITLTSEFLLAPDGTNHGLLGEYFDNPDFQGKPLFARVDSKIDFEWTNSISPDPQLKPTDYSIRWTGKLVPPRTQTYYFSLTSDDGSRLYLNGKKVVDNWGEHGMSPKSGAVNLDAGKAYDIRIEFYQGGGDAGMRFGWRDPKDHTPEPTIAEAVAMARGADAVVLCVGNTSDTEGEGNDVADFKMSGGQDELVRAVLQANSNTVVVVWGGVPVLMKPWLTEAKAVVAALYPGQEGGTALAQILTGEINPSGKLPFSYIQKRSEASEFAGYKDPGLKVNYSEGVFVGYRYYDRNKIKPLFPFGYGLSYTTFKYDHLRIKKTGPAACEVVFDVKNTGPVAGAETAQIYVGPQHPPVPRPVRELKGFAKVQLAPGETKTVTIPLGDRAFEFFDPKKNQWTLAPGTFDVFIGASSRDLRLSQAVKIQTD
jgi:beta-glucosidase